MRIALGQLWQETNTLSPLATERADFEQFGVLRGDDVVTQLAHTNEVGGFIQSLRRWPVPPELVGLVRLPAWPSGLATSATFDWLASEFAAALGRAGPVDAVLLALHGAMAAAGHSDVEGEILALVRQQIGPTVPLVATLDLHANITPAMVAMADALVLYHTAPHVDVYQTGERGARVLQRILCEGARPTTAFQKIPAALPAERANTQAAAGASVDFRRQLEAWEQRPAVLTAGLATVQPWLDVPEYGSSVLVTTDGQPDLARELCAQLARDVWQRRREYLPELVSIEEGVARARQETRGLVVLSDAADATTSGAPGDSVWLLKELARYDWPRPVLVTVVAPEIVVAATECGVGGTWRGTLGGVRDTRFGCRLPWEAEVERLFAARFVLNGHLGRNLPIDMGASAVLRRGEVRVIVTSRSGPHFAPELFRAAGFDPFAASVVVAKSPCGFRAVYADHAAAIYSVRAPGCAPTDFWNYPFTLIPRPTWPWDEIPAWEPDPAVRWTTGHAPNSVS
ncbi:MAG: M81 family metallopeptidase [Pirellulales bacterium]